MGIQVRMHSISCSGINGINLNKKHPDEVIFDDQVSIEVQQHPFGHYNVIKIESIASIGRTGESVEFKSQTTFNIETDVDVLKKENTALVNALYIELVSASYSHHRALFTEKSKGTNFATFIIPFKAIHQINTIVQQAVSPNSN